MRSISVSALGTIVWLAACARAVAPASPPRNPDADTTPDVTRDASAFPPPDVDGTGTVLVVRTPEATGSDLTGEAWFNAQDLADISDWPTERSEGNCSMRRLVGPTAAPAESPNAGEIDITLIDGSILDFSPNRAGTYGGVTRFWASNPITPTGVAARGGIVPPFDVSAPFPQAPVLMRPSGLVPGAADLVFDTSSDLTISWGPASVTSGDETVAISLIREGSDPDRTTRTDVGIDCRVTPAAGTLTVPSDMLSELRAFMADDGGVATCWIATEATTRVTAGGFAVAVRYSNRAFQADVQLR